MGARSQQHAFDDGGRYCGRGANAERASMSMAVAVKPGDFSKRRIVIRRSWKSIWAGPLGDESTFLPKYGTG